MTQKYAIVYAFVWDDGYDNAHGPMFCTAGSMRIGLCQAKNNLVLYNASKEVIERQYGHVYPTYISYLRVLKW